ncbi:hypothetical protein NDU88_001955 [Pleurodeles waltl]|uniref:Uncharacterized protein n=1 Tax=Pleurodeles waltl TaxID=8319 RepID=A0AAV7MP51_PLEWA|nr:hypothetical protein NDU88_001955 [Pleurodeles waltl]
MYPRGTVKQSTGALVFPQDVPSELVTNARRKGDQVQEVREVNPEEEDAVRKNQEEASAGTEEGRTVRVKHQEATVTAKCPATFLEECGLLRNKLAYVGDTGGREEEPVRATALAAGG